MKKLTLILPILLCCTAFAADTNLSQNLLNLALTAAGIVLTALIGKASNWMNTKIKQQENTLFQDALGLISELAFRKIQEINQASIDLLKQKAGDGKLTLDESAAALNTAATEVWNSLPLHIQQELQKHATTDALDQFVVPVIEQHIQSSKAVQLHLNTLSEKTPKPVFNPSPELLDAALKRIGLH